MNTDVVAALIFLGFLAGVYFLPTIIAGGRGHGQVPQIFFTNLLFGWTFVGWAIALIWALRKRTEVAVAPASTTVPPQFQPQSSQSPSSESKVCPRCAETVKLAAKVCRYCGHDFGEAETKQNSKIQG
jgi:uncharacterized paraquat-inducible protein A